MDIPPELQAILEKEKELLKETLKQEETMYMGTKNQLTTRVYYKMEVKLVVSTFDTKFKDFEE